MQSLIISGGSLDMEFALSYIEKYSFGILIAADRGMDFFYQQKITPDYVVGDFDSADPKILQYFRSLDEDRRPVILQFHPEKDETDTELAINTAIKLGCTHITILGATGGRFDHMLANVFLLYGCLQKGVKACILDRQDKIYLIEDTAAFSRSGQWGKYISFLPLLGEIRGITLEGFKYPLEDYTLKMGSSRCISNELVEETGRIHIREGVAICVESRD